MVSLSNGTGHETKITAVARRFPSLIQKLESQIHKHSRTFVGDKQNLSGTFPVALPACNIPTFYVHSSEIITVN